MAQQVTEETDFDQWLFRNGLRISRSLREKLFNNHLDSVDVLTQLKASNEVEESLQYLNLNVIENAMFNAIVHKVPLLTTHTSTASQRMYIAPQLISLTDNNNGTVNIKIKVAETELDNANKCSLRLEWSEDEKAFDIGRKPGVILPSNDIQIGSVHEFKNVSVKSNAEVFRLIWRQAGNIKPFRLRVEEWDANHKGDVISVNDTVIKHSGSSDSWRSIYGTVECKPPYIYHWKFRIKTYKPYLMFGVEKVVNNYGLEQDYAGTKGACYYSDNDTSYVYHTQDGNHISGDYGSKRLNKNGGELDMYLDLSSFELRFEINGQDIGYKIQNLSEENYRMVVSLHTPGVRIELVQFDSNQ